jgi:hypothetical protein
MTISAPDATLAIPRHVLSTEVNGEAVLLNISDECYYGLDEVGTIMWKALAAHASIDAAVAAVQQCFDACPERIRTDMLELVRRLAKHRLVEVTPSAEAA